MPVSRGSGTALWRQIQEQLESEVATGLFGPGEKFPTEFSLADRFGVNRHTVRRAVAAMEEKGILRVEQGRGTFVQEHIVDYTVGKRTRFTENILGQRRLPSGRLIDSDEFPADAAVAHALAVAKGTPILVIRTLREADDRPLTLGNAHFEAARVRGLVEAFRDLGSITQALAQLGIRDYTRKTTRITTQMPTREQAHLLQQPANRPVLVSESINVDPVGRPLEYGVTTFAGDRVQIVLES